MAAFVGGVGDMMFENAVEDLRKLLHDMRGEVKASMNSEIMAVHKRIEHDYSAVLIASNPPEGKRLRREMSKVVTSVQKELADLL